MIYFKSEVQLIFNHPLCVKVPCLNSPLGLANWHHSINQCHHGACTVGCNI